MFTAKLIPADAKINGTLFTRQARSDLNKSEESDCQFLPGREIIMSAHFLLFSL